MRDLVLSTHGDAIELLLLGKQPAGAWRGEGSEEKQKWVKDVSRSAPGGDETPPRSELRLLIKAALLQPLKRTAAPRRLTGRRLDWGLSQGGSSHSHAFQSVSQPARGNLVG